MKNPAEIEINAMRRIYVVLSKLPKDAQFRALAFMVDHTAGVAHSVASEYLYERGRVAREEIEASSTK